MVDFEMEKPMAWKLDEVNKSEILFNFQGRSNQPLFKAIDTHPHLEKLPIDKKQYEQRFNLVHRSLERGDSYLANLTIKTEVKLNVTLRELYYQSDAKYKLLFNDEFLVFSPESFVQISDGNIFSFPMKGTIDASIPDASNILLNDQKELAEHVTIVDLIRNDLSQIANNVRVKRFRYIDLIQTNNKKLLQVSSEIVGDVEGAMSRLGTILVSLLPAGSVSGAPKAKTLEIIKEAEGEKRGYYTGVMGIFDGHRLDSGVMIRFIEHVNGKYYYRSGGGITTQSASSAEYQEAIDKIYVPVN
jgi:para-aminobenzoate synthetase component 1